MVHSTYNLKSQEIPEATTHVATEKKDTNPKDAVGVSKWRQFAAIPNSVIFGLGVAMLEGALKYGRHNYRVAGVRSSIYYEAAMGHLMAWWEGEDVDPDSGLPHVVKAMASLAVLYDAIAQGKLNDDRPPKFHNFQEFQRKFGSAVQDLLSKHKETAVEPYTENNKENKR